MAEGASRPCGRWGHTLRELGTSHLALFGGCSSRGPLNDVFLLDLNRTPPVRCAGGPVENPLHKPIEKPIEKLMRSGPGAAW